MRKKLLIAVPVIVLIGAGIYAITTRRTADDGSIRFSGNIEVDEVQAAFQIPGRLVERPVSEGDRVPAGAVLGRIDDTEIQHEIASRRAELESAKARLAELQGGFRPEEIGEARASVRGAQSEFERQASELERQKTLFAGDVISRRELEAAENAYRTAAARADQARQRLLLLERGVRSEQIEQARARVDQAAQAVAAVETRGDYATLRSPIDGTVLSESAQPGEMLPAGAPVVTLGDLSSIYVNGYIPEPLLGKLVLGDSVTIRSDTYPGRRYSGTVSFISSEAEFTPKQVQTAEERVKLVYRIKVRVENPNFELKPGMPVDAVIAPATGR